MSGGRQHGGDDDVAMREAISAIVPAGVDFAWLTRDRLAVISRRFGCDFATALFYDRARREPSIKAFVDAVDAHRGASPVAPPPGAKLLIAPAAFYRELPRFGGDGTAIRAVAERLGWSCELLPVESRGGVTRNAEAIREALEGATDGPILVVSLSKGAADVRIALERLARTPETLRGWVQICGMLRGSPIIDAILDSRLRRTLLSLYLKTLRADVSVCDELRWQDNALLTGPQRAPSGVEVVSVVGFPLSTHMRGNARRRYLQLRRFGPNDGSALLHDAVFPGASLYPVWGADHYFKVPDVPNLVGALLNYFAVRWSA